MRWTLVVALSFLPCVGCGPLPEERALNKRTEQLGEDLTKNENPVVAAVGAEVADNSKALDAGYLSKAPATCPVPTTPEESSALRKAIAEAYAASAATWTFIRELLKTAARAIPGGEATMTAIIGIGTTLAALWRSRRWRNVAVSTIKGVQEYREKGLPAAIDGLLVDSTIRQEAKVLLDAVLKGRLKSSQEEAGVQKMAEVQVNKLKSVNVAG